LNFILDQAGAEVFQFLLLAEFPPLWKNHFNPDLLWLVISEFAKMIDGYTLLKKVRSLSP